jgi:serine/threonine protein kinase
MFTPDGEVKLIDFSYARFIKNIHTDEQAEETATQNDNIFEGTIYYSARLQKSDIYPSHSLPKHDLESVIYVMASMCDHKLPWNEELIGRDLEDLDDYFKFKAQVTDEQV